MRRGACSNGPRGDVATTWRSTPPTISVLHPGQGFYFTDCLPKKGAVIFVDQEGRQTVVARDLDTPNGIVLSADCRRLYVSESYPNRWSSSGWRPRGRAEHPPGSSPTFPGIPTGKRKVRPAGRHGPGPGGPPLGSPLRDVGGSSPFPEGRLLGTYDTGMRCTSNICLPATIWKPAFITGGTVNRAPAGLVRLDVGVPGAADPAASC